LATLPPIAVAHAGSMARAVPHASPSLLLKDLVVPQRQSAKIEHSLLTGQQSILHANPHAATVCATNNKFVDDLLEVDDVSITYSHAEFMQHALARALQQHIDHAQQRVQQQHKGESNGRIDLARIDAHVRQREEEAAPEEPEGPNALKRRGRSRVH
jgi:hypothetical protein